MTTSKTFFRSVRRSWHVYAELHAACPGAGSSHLCPGIRHHQVWSMVIVLQEAWANFNETVRKTLNIPKEVILVIRIVAFMTNIN